MEAIDTLITARWVLPVEPGNECLPDHAIAVRGGRILAVLPTAEAHARYAARDVIDRPHHVVLPGLVDATTQTSTRLLRGIPVAPARPAAQWLDPEFARLGALLSIVERLTSGVTCLAERGLYPDAVLQSAVDVGMRINIGLPIAEGPGYWATGTTEYFERGLRLRDEHRDHPLVTTAFAISAPETLADPTLVRLQKLADQLDLPVAMAPRDMSGLLDRLEHLGLLNRSLTLAQPTGLSTRDAERLALAGSTAVVSLAATPRRALEALSLLASAQVAIALGTGDGAQAQGLDVLTTLRLASSETTGTSRPAVSDLRSATLNGARALGLEDEIGSLVPGKWADACCLDLHHPTLLPADEPGPDILLRASRDAVTDTWVGGQALYTAGTLTRLDSAALRARIQALPRPVSHASTAVNRS